MQGGITGGHGDGKLIKHTVTQSNRSLPVPWLSAQASSTAIILITFIPRRHKFLCGCFVATASVASSEQSDGTPSSPAEAPVPTGLTVQGQDTHTPGPGMPR